MIQRHHSIAIVLLILTAIVGAIAGREFLRMHLPDTLYPGSTLTSARLLSDYHAKLAHTNGNTAVYIFDSHRPGGTLLVLGGTHPNEPAAFITAVVLLEHAVVSTGRMIVIPQASLSGFSCTDPLEGYPQSFTLQTPSGKRSFRFGSRGMNPVDQWPDPLVYLQYPSGQKLSGVETRNLNRSYPGRPDGSLTEQVGYAIMQLLVKEHVDIAFDLHEAAPEIPIINAIIVHEKAKDIGAEAVLNLQLENLEYALELSPSNFHGLSHREWGDRTNVIPVLMETSNPIQGRLRGRTSEELLVNGVDEWYRQAAQLGTVRITYNLDGQPMSQRVARHITGLLAVLSVYNDRFPEKKILLENLPGYEDILTQGVGSFLH